MFTWQNLFIGGALLTYFVAVPAAASAAWPDTPEQQITVNTSPVTLETGSAPDGAGGIITVFHHSHPTTGQDIHARRYNNLGQLIWGSGPVIVCNAPGDQTDIRVIPTPDGGCFVLWTDARNGNFDVYGQKLAASGQTLLTANGAPLVSGAGGQLLQNAVPDGAGGFILAYQQGTILSARRFGGTGNSLWPSAAIISDTAGDLVTDMISDGNGGCYVALERVGIGSEVVIQPISAAGNPDFDQLLSLNAGGNQRNLKLALRSNGTVLAVWYDGGVTPSRLVANEFVSPLVVNPNVPLPTGTAPVLDDFRLISSQAGDPLIQYGTQATLNTNAVFVGRINAAGQLLFNTQLPGITATQEPDNLVETPAGIIRATFRDAVPGQPFRKLLAAQLSPDGTFQWRTRITPDDVAFKSTPLARLINGSQNSLIVFSKQVLIPGTKTAALIRVRANGVIGGELALPDLAFGQSLLFATKKNRKATLTGDLVVRNIGIQPSNDTTIHVYASPSPNPAASGRVFLFEMPLGSLQPNTQTTLTPGLLPPKKPGKNPKVRKIKLPKEAKVMQFYMFIFLDTANTNAEIDEDNNYVMIGPI